LVWAYLGASSCSTLKFYMTLPQSIVIHNLSVQAHRRDYVFTGKKVILRGRWVEPRTTRDTGEVPQFSKVEEEGRGHRWCQSVILGSLPWLLAFSPV
jgi:hypothetical protein